MKTPNRVAFGGCPMNKLLLVSLGLVLGIAVGRGVAMPYLSAHASGPEVRFPQLTMAELNDSQRTLAREVIRISSTGLGGPYNSMLRSPVMGERLFALLDYLRFHTSLPHRLNEFAILIQARIWTSQVEWRAHYPLAIKAGLSKAVADDLAEGKRPASMQPDEAVVYDLCTELSTKHEVSDSTFKRARAILTDQQLVDLVAVSGTYVLTAMLLKNAAEEGTPDGKIPLLKPIPLR
jgi:4-carboxymuconolactone decarboxylase